LYYQGIDFELLEEINMNNRTRTSITLVVCGLSIALGPGFGGYFIGKAIERFKTHDRTVVVKGLSEREVKSDLSVWTLSFKASGDDLTTLDEKMDQDSQMIMKFLKSQGFKDEEIKSEGVSVKDKLASEYENGKVHSRYITKSSITVRTGDVDLVTKAMSELGQLIKEGVIISGEPHFYYTKFTDLRPGMIAEATKTARQSALQFANDSGAKVGYIRSANQGVFSISGKNSQGEGADYNEIRSVEKKIRVVSTITFSLEQ